MRDPINLDHNATTPVAPEVLDAMLPWLRGEFGNPSGAHPHGRRAAQAVATARGQVAGLIGAGAPVIIFTGCATEANNLALLGVARALGVQKQQLGVCAAELPTHCCESSLNRRHRLTKRRHTLRMFVPLSRRKSATDLKSGAMRPSRGPETTVCH